MGQDGASEPIVHDLVVLSVRPPLGHGEGCGKLEPASPGGQRRERGFTSVSHLACSP